MRDYQIISPSLEGILSHHSIVYEGINRPVEVLRALDGPAKRLHGQAYTEKEQKILHEYFQDIHGVFMKKFSDFVLDAELNPEYVLKLQALLHELIKIKKLIIQGREIKIK